MERSWPRQTLSQGVLSRLETGALLLVPSLHGQPSMQHRASPGDEKALHLGFSGPHLSTQERKAHGRASSSVKTRRTRRASAHLASGYFMSLSSERPLSPDLHLEQVF